jgi:hypothetical protein
MSGTIEPATGRELAGIAAVAAGVAVATLLTVSSHAQQPAAPAEQAAFPMARFVGIWVGTQAWAISNPPPGSNHLRAQPAAGRR